MLHTISNDESLCFNNEEILGETVLKEYKVTRKKKETKEEELHRVIAEFEDPTTWAKNDARLAPTLRKAAEERAEIRRRSDELAWKIFVRAT